MKLEVRSQNSGARARKAGFGLVLALLVLVPAFASAGIVDSMWTRIWDGVGGQVPNTAARVLYDSSRGRVYVCGQGETDADAGQTDMMVLCYDTLGNVLWSHSAGWGLNTDMGYTMAFRDSTVYLAGLVDWGNNPNKYDIAVIKYVFHQSTGVVDPSVLYSSSRDKDEICFDMVAPAGSNRLFLVGSLESTQVAQSAYYVLSLRDSAYGLPLVWTRAYVMSPVLNGVPPPSQRRHQTTDVWPEFFELPEYTDWDNAAVSIALSPDGDIVTTGICWYSSGQRSDYDWWTMKFGRDGTRRWATQSDYPGTTNGGADDDFGLDLAVGPDNAVYVAGIVLTDSGPGDPMNDFAVMKYNGSDGVRAGATRIVNNDADDAAFGICLDNANPPNIYATGYLETPGAAMEDIATAKFRSTDLSRRWLGTYDGEEGDDHAYEVLYKSGRVYVTGVRGGGGGGPDRVVALGYTEDDPPSGPKDTLWTYAYHHAGTQGNMGASIYVGDTNRVFVAGQADRSGFPPWSSVYLSRLLIAHPDVAVMSIVAPRDTIGLYVVVDTPRVWVKNRGNLLPTFKTWLHIGTGYEDTAWVETLKPGDSALVKFRSWTAFPLGNRVVTCSISIAPDENVANNRLVDTVFVSRVDAACLGIVEPVGTVDSGASVTPRAWLKNFSNQARTIDARFTIGSYADTQSVALPPGDSTIMSFDPWTAPGRGSFATLCSTMLAGDDTDTNDWKTGTVNVRVSDVAMTAIVAPVDAVDSGDVVMPRSRLANYGTGEESFWAFFRMQYDSGVVGYIDSVYAVVPAGAETTVTFALSAPLQHVGQWDLVAYHGLTDMHPENDTLTALFLVRSKRGTWPRGWVEVTPMPTGITSKAVKAGGSVTHDVDRLYATKGYKTPEFYEYDPETDVWFTRTPVPPGLEAKMPYHGTDLVGDGNGTVYMTKGNSTFGFWKYTAADSSWTQLANVPTGPNGAKVKGGTGLVWVQKADTGFVYLLKGYRNEFYRYDPAINQWQVRANAPTGANLKWNKGSWIAHDDANFIYAAKARYNEFWRYDIDRDSWQATQLAGMPLINSLGRRKKIKDGSAGDWYYPGYIFALKGGNTCEFYRYDVAKDSWLETDSMPQYGSTGRRRKVNAGGDMTYYNEAYWALKGNKTRELWRYGLPLTSNAEEPLPRRDGVMASPMPIAGWGFEIAPNPLTGSGVLRYSVPRATDLTVKAYTADGRYVATLVPGRRIVGTGSVSLNADKLASGVYVVRLSAGATGTMRSFKLVVR